MKFASRKSIRAGLDRSGGLATAKAYISRGGVHLDVGRTRVQERW